MAHRKIETNAQHLALKADIAAILKKYEHLPNIEILAVASQIVGILIAHQDQEKVTPASAMRTVSANIEVGNQSAFEALSNPMGRA